jgi:two-component system sensor histidine kinase LytS
MKDIFGQVRKIILRNSYVRHGLFWCVIFILQVVSTINLSSNFVHIEYLIGNMLIQIFFAYIAYGVYKIAGKLNSLLIFCLLILGVAFPYAMLLNKWQLYIYPSSPLGRKMMYFYPGSLLFILFFVALKYAKDLYIWQQEEFLRKQEQSDMELNFLKAQISPHFLFNTLNNLYGHAVTKSNALPDMMLRLSDLLRYSLYETSKPLVPLSDELDYIKNYIALEKLRISNDENVRFDLPETFDNTLQIAPLILISFIENAFKHSRHTMSDALRIFGNIQMNGNKMTMYLENTYNPEAKEDGIVNQRGGVGLDNVQKRLNLVYPERHKLKIEKKGGIYALTLSITL